MGLRLFTSSLIAAFALSSLSSSAADSSGMPPLGVMRRVPLQSGIPYEVGIGLMPTTILMPAPIEAFQSEGITTSDRQASNVFLDHTPGTRFFSVKALTPGVADLNVLCNGEFYSFRFFLSDNPTRTLTVLPAETYAPKATRSKMTPQRLYALLQDAKSYFIVEQAQPGYSREIQVAAPGSIQPAGSHRIILDQVFRFEKDDTLCFRVIFLNDTFSRLSYKAEQIAVRIGTDVHRPSFADLSGEMPSASPGSLVWHPARPGVKATLIAPDLSENDVSGSFTLELTRPGRYVLRLTAPETKPQEYPFTVDRLAEPTAADVAPFPISGKDSLLADATLKQPRSGQSFGYILITGMPDGRRGEISIQNDFKFIVPVQPTP
jgi:hypothetical protein